MAWLRWQGSIPCSSMLRSRSTLDRSKRSLPCRKQNIPIGEFFPVGNRKREDMGMLDVLKYIFSSFWVFSGTVVLIWNIGIMLALIFGAIFGGSKKK